MFEDLKSANQQAEVILLVQKTEECDGSKKFLIDRWERDAQDANAGYGITAVLEGGQLLEKVGFCRSFSPPHKLMSALH